MPNKSLHFCNQPGCSELTSDRYCKNHMKDHEFRKKSHKRCYDKNRGSASSRGYDSKWRKASKSFLRKNPLCVECAREGTTTPATVVDHIIPHKGNTKIFWDKNNWQGLCKRHHDIKTVKEDGGFGNKIKQN